ncbi:hypothetical protein CHUAL_010550 [Chamberlinius hualienensis]
MASLGGSVIGVSRSGRVRKKSAKLMEMEDSEYGEGEPGRRKSSGNSTTTTTTQGSTPSSGTIHISYIPQTPRDKTVSYLNPKSRQTQNASNSRSKHGNSGSKSRRASGTQPVSSKKRKKQPSPLPPPQLEVEKDDEDEDDSTEEEIQTEERVIALKRLSPTFETLSGSAYLMGEDLHFITGEPVVSNDEDSNPSNNDDFNSSDQLKVDVGYTDEASVSVSEESGLKMKFILSPKSGIKSSKSGKSSSKKKKSSNRRKSSHGSSSKSRAKSKKKSQSSADDVAALDLLASGGILPENDDSDDLMLSDEGNDYIGESKLIIAEPRQIDSKSKRKKKKRSSSKNLADDESSTKKGSKKFKQNSEIDSSVEMKELVEEELSVTEMTPSALPQSLYFKEKNSAKKKFNKKPVAKPKEKTEKKVRPITAYMLWSQEYRKIIVSENPTFDFAQISRRLGEIWQSYPEKEKMQWRSKAKLKSGKLAIMNTSNIINTSKKPVPEVIEKPRALPPTPLKPIQIITKPIDEQPLSPRDPNKVVGTSPLDVAAHLKLLGESLGTIGQRLTEHEGQIAVSGSLSVLLDSTLCALGPLLCLTQEVQQLDGCPKEVHQKVLDNIAYIMPGL